MSQIPSLAGASWLVRSQTQAVLAAIGAGGHQARIVGGAVRSALLGRAVADIDISTTARPQEVMTLATAAGLQVIATGIEHGTVTVVADRIPYEVTTLRRDVATDGRHAQVAFTDDWAADASRRDFTLNALYCDGDGTLFDPLDGLPDLLARRIRFIGDPGERIREDYLRILRFFRFHADIGRGPIDAQGLAACGRERAGLDRLSAERVRGEIVRLLVADGVLVVINTMHDHGFLARLIGAVPRPSLLASLVAREGVLNDPPDAMLRLSALAVGVEEDRGRIVMQLRLSRSERDSLVPFEPTLARLGEIEDVAARATLYHLGAERWRRQVIAGWCMAGDELDDETWRSLATLPDRWPIPQFPLRGEDAVAAGLSAGPQVGRVLRQLESAWIADDFAADRIGLLAAMADVIATLPSDPREDRTK
jgi:poly(A) polymerase